KHRRLKRRPCVWTDKEQIYTAFERLFAHYQESILVVSYRSDGIPSEQEILSLLQLYKQNVHVERFRHYKYVLSTNHRADELLFIAR
ncbi:MAG: DNA methyltransferase, partial [Chloroflexota bacterium]|nr:DNA methyltransferase [Chloroflexota bacterium]